MDLTTDKPCWTMYSNCCITRQLHQTVCYWNCGTRKHKTCVSFHGSDVSFEAQS